MPDGKWVRSDQLTQDVLAPYLKPSSNGEADVREIPYGDGCVSIQFANGAARTVMIVTNRVGRWWPQVRAPLIARPDGTAAHQLPATEAGLIEVLGKPSKTRNFWFDT
ncbi:MAG: hypothetical protein ACREJC_08345 [Tepidisphaeraceae bacterium]